MLNDDLNLKSLGFTAIINHIKEGVRIQEHDMKNHKRILTGFLALPTLMLLATLVALTSDVSLSNQQAKKPDFELV